MFRRSKDTPSIFGDHVSPESVESILRGETPVESRKNRILDFVWIWFSEEQVTGPEIGSAIDLASASGGVIDLFPPIAAFWFGLFERETSPDIDQIVHDLKRFTENGAKIIQGHTTGSPKNIGSKNHFNYSVISPDRSSILRQLAAADAGSVISWKTGSASES